MNKKFLLITMMLTAAAIAYSQNAADLLRQVDNNEIYSTIVYEGDIIIEHGGRRFVKTMKAWARGRGESFIEFTNPEDVGTRYLMENSRLWVISPDIERARRISGHMLRESMMGSDMSYEDTINNDTLSSRYDPTLVGSEVWVGSNGSRDAWVLELKAKKKDESYPIRKLWIDKGTGDLLHYEMYALSGAKLKEYTLRKVEVIGGRRFPTEGEMRDVLRRNSRTIFVMRNVVLDQPIADSVFSRRNLER